MLAFITGIRGYLYAGLAVGLIGTFGWYTYHERSLGAAHEAVAVEKASAKVQAEADAKIAALVAAHTKEVATIQETINAQIKAANDQHDSDSQRLRDYDAYRNSHQPVRSATSTPADSKPGNTVPDVSGDSLGSLEQVALGLTDAVKSLMLSLNACMAERNDLVGK